MKSFDLSAVLRPELEKRRLDGGNHGRLQLGAIPGECLEQTDLGLLEAESIVENHRGERDAGRPLILRLEDRFMKAQVQALPGCGQSLEPDARGAATGVA